MTGWPVICRWLGSVLGKGSLGLVCATLILIPASIATARQLGEIVVRVMPTEQTPDDGYWPWLVKYVDDWERAESRIDAIMGMLSIQARQSAKHRARWLAFFKEEYASSKLAPERVLRKERDRIKREIDTLKRDQRGLVREAQGFLDTFRQRVTAQMARSGDRRPGLGQELDRLTAMQPLLTIELYDSAEWYREDELPRQFRKLDVAKLLTPDAGRYYRARANIGLAKSLERRILTQAVAANGRGVDPKLVERMHILRLEALKDMRALAAKRPELDRVRALVQEEELYWVRQVARKVEQQARLTLTDFQAYLSERGFSADDTGGWPQGVMELFSAWFGLGPIALTGGVMNVPGTQAQIVAQSQAQKARNIIALNTIIRLIKNGVPLSSVPSVTPETLRHNVSLRQADRRPLPILRARELVVDIHRTLRELPDLNALTSPEPFYFSENVVEKFAENYFEAVDSDYHSYEYFGDIWNVRNLVTFWGAGAVTRTVGNRLGFATSAQLAAARAQGATVGHKIFVASGLKWYGETLSKTGVGQRIAAMMTRRSDIAAAIGDRAIRLWQQGGGANRALAAFNGTAYAMGTVNSMAALMGTMFGAHYLASMTGFESLVLLVDMIAMFQLDNHFFEVAFRSNLPLGKIARKLDEAATRVANTRKTVQRIQAVIDDAASDGTAAARRVSSAVEGGAGAPLGTLKATKAVPLNQMDAAEHAAVSAQRAKSAGDIAEAKRAASAGKTMAGKADEQLEKVSRKITKAQKRVAAASKKSSQAISPSKLPKQKPISVDDEKLGKRFYDENLYTGTAGESIAAGDKALQADDLDDALKHYQKAYKDATRSPRVDRDLQDHLAERVALIFNAKKARKELELLRKNAPKILAPKAPITAGEEKAVQDAIDTALQNNNLDKVLKKIGGGANPLYEFTDPATGQRFLIKKMEPAGDVAAKLQVAHERLRDAINAGDQNAEKIARDLLKGAVKEAAESSEQKVRRELFGAAVMNELGLNAPANRRLRLSNVKVKHQRTVTIGGKERTINVEETLEHAVIVRPVDGMEELLDKTEAELIALRRDIAKQRAARALIGDSDGHLSNLAVDKNGVFWNIDFDNASINGNSLAQIIDSGYANEAELMQAAILLAHGRDPRSSGVVWKTMLKSGVYSPMARADEMIRLKDLERQFEVIESFDSGAMARRLSDAGFDNSEVSSFMRLLNSRKDKVRPALGADKMFGGGTLKFSWLWLLRPTRHALLWAPCYCALGAANDNAATVADGRRSDTGWRQAA